MFESQSHMKVIVTGAAGFIGMHTALALLERGDTVVGVDDLNAYYEPALKERRLSHLLRHSGFEFRRMSVADRDAVAALFDQVQPRKVVHLAAQPGVRHSLTHPFAYVEANLQGFMTVLEGCRRHSIAHFVYASSSSVYGGNTAMPFSEQQGVDHPISLYAATKKANELMAHTYSHLFQLPTTGLRFFTVYGPWGRPDMAPFLFASAILAGRTIDVYNHGRMLRDFTYIDDVVECVLRVLDKPATPDPLFDPSAPDPSSASAPYRIFNVGNSQPVPLMEFIAAIEAALGRAAIKNFLPMQAADVAATFADTTALAAWTGFSPSTTLETGVGRFIEWYKSYYEFS